MRALREQVQQVLYAVPARRKPALRRSDAADALLATDLPLVAEPEAVTAFIRDITARGWQCGERNGWLTLDAAVPAPEADMPDAPGEECGCCISLLLRHPEEGEAEPFIRALVKAADAGCIPFERLCGQLHSEFAAMLRNGQPLPGALLPYLCYAYHSFNK